MKNKIKWKKGIVQIFGHKYFEYQFDLLPSDNDETRLVYFNFMITRKTDHAGISFSFDAYKTLSIRIDIYDNRHWDYDNECWVGELK